MFLHSLSGRFLILTMAFVLLVEALTFVPSIARFREDYLLARLERAQIASLSQLAADDSISTDLEAELLQNAEVFNVVLRRDEVRQLILSSPIPSPIHATYDLRMENSWTMIRDAVMTLFDSHNRVIRVIGSPVREGGLLIEITMETGPLRAAMQEYALRLFLLSATIILVTALLLFLSVRRLILSPIRRVMQRMTAYAEAPEDVRLVIEPEARITELREAETALRSVQTQLTGALRQKDRLAQLGSAVAKISHDLRNILSTAQLVADRLEESADPAVQRAAPKLVNSISRAVNLCEGTMAFGRAEEPPPKLSRFMLQPVIEDVAESERVAAGQAPLEIRIDVPASLSLRADREQLHRVLTNLVRNARQAIEATARPGRITVSAGEDEINWWIRIGDTGPGLPLKTREHLFQPFQSGVRRGGTGLGLAIAAELVRGHGGQIDLLKTDEQGTDFILRLPRAVNVAAGPSVQGVAQPVG